MDIIIDYIFEEAREEGHYDASHSLEFRAILNESLLGSREERWEYERGYLHGYIEGLEEYQKSSGIGRRLN